jgi:hypothetical protein
MAGKQRVIRGTMAHGEGDVDTGSKAPIHFGGMILIADRGSFG